MNDKFTNQPCLANIDTHNKKKKKTYKRDFVTFLLYLFSFHLSYSSNTLVTDTFFFSHKHKAQQHIYKNERSTIYTPTRLVTTTPFHHSTFIHTLTAHKLHITPSYSPLPFTHSFYQQNITLTRICQFDPKTQRLFYIYQPTGQVTWDHPLGLAADQQENIRYHQLQQQYQRPPPYMPTASPAPAPVSGGYSPYPYPAAPAAAAPIIVQQPAPVPQKHHGPGTGASLALGAVAGKETMSLKQNEVE
ncbi:hypothetical protein F5H01DRAFT_196558 [Linnemannia elongata]|nr:hypothetical protein F5H01DRAFT_196558 [Linnemannia elongata]